METDQPEHQTSSADNHQPTTDCGYLFRREKETLKMKVMNKIFNFTQFYCWNN